MSVTGQAITHGALRASHLRNSLTPTSAQTARMASRFDAATRTFRSARCVNNLRGVTEAASAGCGAEAGAAGHACRPEHARHPEAAAWHHPTVSGHCPVVGSRTRALAR